MKFWTLIKLLCALGVAGVIGFTCMLSYHVFVNPLDGIFREIIPNPAEVAGRKPDTEFAKMLDSSELPDIDPGEMAYQKAHELIALGKIAEAKEKLTTIVNVFPTSSAAPTARRIVSEMNLDEILSSAHMEGKKSHTVKRGNSFIGIAAEYKTNLDVIMSLNGMTDLKSLQAGEEVVVLPLEFRVLIEPKRKAISIWDGGRFVCEFPILRMGIATTILPARTTITGKLADIDGRQVKQDSKEFRGARKVIQLAKPALQIRGESPGADTTRGLILRAEDMEELSLLTRTGNEVEIR
ncbi:MAG: LysM domain-containing protein [Akkermansiaceae bacterium]|nr:LysM domain-containing protein [Akkermansiaceae bacterium]